MPARAAEWQARSPPTRRLATLLTATLACFLISAPGVPTRTRPLAVWLALLLLVIVGTGPAHATVVGPLPEAMLTAHARVIVIGRVTDISSHWDTRQAQILTDITVRLDEILKGAAPGAEVTIRQLGGRVGDIESRVEGSPEFSVGERVLLFLTTRRDGTLRVAHLYLGKFSIQTDVLTGEAIAQRDTPSGVIVRFICRLLRSSSRKALTPPRKLEPRTKSKPKCRAVRESTSASRCRLSSIARLQCPRK